MKARLSVVYEYSKGRNFEEAVTNLFKNGLMNGSCSTVRVIDREQAKILFRSCYHAISREAVVTYIVTEKYDEEDDEWKVNYTEGIEVLPCH
jgi:hypothetical protein